MRRRLPIERSGPRSSRAGVLALGVLVACASGCGRPVVEAAESALPDSAGASVRNVAGPPGGVPQAERFVVWESNRGGKGFRIWHASLDRDAAPARQISPDEPGRDHCCPTVSPDGARLVYLSLPAQKREYLPGETAGELRLVELESGRARVLSTTARQNGENRGAVWWSATELVYLEGDGSTRRLDLAAGTNREIVPASEGGGWLVAPGGAFASRDQPTFSRRGPDGAISLATPMGGCQPLFTLDGEYGLWTAGAGGPLDVIDLETRATRSIVRRGDPRLPEGRRYLYFPAISADRTLLAWAASDGSHDHFRSDYDLFVGELDPETLELAAAPRAIAPHPAVDRYPTLFSSRKRSRNASGRAAGATPASALEAASPATAPLFAWNFATDLNARTPGAPSETLTERGAAWYDRRGRLALGGGHAEASVESAKRIEGGLKSANAFTLALVVEPASLERGAAGALVALERRADQRAFAVRQRGAELELQMLTAASRLTGGAKVTLVNLPDRGPHHVAFRYSPGRLAVFLDGALAGRQVVAGDFFHWKSNGSLRFGAELGDAARWRGWLSDVAIWDRELSDAELAAHAQAALGRLRKAPAVAGAVVEARLVARSKVPTLAEISPYRRALVVEEYELVAALAGQAPPHRFRVARWALLSGEPAPELALAKGATTRLALEPYDAQPQLGAVVLSDTLPGDPALKLYASVGLDGRVAIDAPAAGGAAGTN